MSMVPSTSDSSRRTPRGISAIGRTVLRAFAGGASVIVPSISGSLPLPDSCSEPQVSGVLPTSSGGHVVGPIVAAPVACEIWPGAITPSSLPAMRPSTITPHCAGLSASSSVIAPWIASLPWSPPGSSSTSTTTLLNASVLLASSMRPVGMRTVVSLPTGRNWMTSALRPPVALGVRSSDTR